MSEDQNPDDPPRQYVLHILRQHGGELTVGRLLDELLAWEQKTYGEASTEARRVELRRWLLDTYLPQLEENGIVEYDETDATVEVA